MTDFIKLQDLAHDFLYNDRILCNIINPVYRGISDLKQVSDNLVEFALNYDEINTIGVCNPFKLNLKYYVDLNEVVRYE